MAFTYDNTTSRGKVRLLIGDTVTGTAIFDDSEIDAFLAMESANYRLAAATAFGAIIRDKAKLTKVVTLGGYRTEQHAIDSLRQLASDLKDEAISAGGLQTGELDGGDEIFESYRPTWRAATDPPVVE